jgi:DNA-binding response OmpR family regulator
MAWRVLHVTRMIGNATPVTRPTVLVVDDENGPREAFRLVLEDHFNVLTADSGSAALGVLRDTPVDVVTLDLMMPVLSGVETLRRIRELDSDVEVVIVSAMPARDVTSKCVYLRAFEILAKPFSRVEILAAAKRASTRRNDRRRAQQSAAPQTEQRTAPRRPSEIG